MSPESFNAALAQRKLEAADILFVQAKRGSDADRIRAASAILRIAFFPIANSPSLREGAGGRVRGVSEKPTAHDPSVPQAGSLQVSSRRQSDESSRSAAAGTPPNGIPTPPGSYSPVSAQTSTATDTSHHTRVPTFSPATHNAPILSSA